MIQKLIRISWQSIIAGLGMTVLMVGCDVCSSITSVNLVALKKAALWAFALFIAAQCWRVYDGAVRSRHWWYERQNWRKRQFSVDDLFV